MDRAGAGGARRRGFAPGWTAGAAAGYAQVSRVGLALHLSGHHGDASPGSTVVVRMEGVRAYHEELTRRRYDHNRPGVEDQPWGLVRQLTDPFGNRIRFRQERPGAQVSGGEWFSSSPRPVSADRPGEIGFETGAEPTGAGVVGAALSSHPDAPGPRPTCVIARRHGQRARARASSAV